MLFRSENTKNKSDILNLTSTGIFRAINKGEKKPLPKFPRHSIFATSAPTNQAKKQKAHSCSSVHIEIGAKELLELVLENKEYDSEFLEKAKQDTITWLQLVIDAETSTAAATINDNYASALASSMDIVNTPAQRELHHMLALLQQRCSAGLPSIQTHMDHELIAEQQKYLCSSDATDNKVQEIINNTKSSMQAPTHQFNPALN